MKYLKYGRIFFGLFFALIFSLSTVFANEYLVKLKKTSGADVRGQDNLLNSEEAFEQYANENQSDVTIIDEINTDKHSDKHIKHISTGKLTIEELQENLSDQIDWIEPNYLWSVDEITEADLEDPSVPNEATSISSKQWGLENPRNTNLDIDIKRGWELTTGINEVVVAIVDTGIDYNHYALKNQLWNNIKEIPDNGIDDDQNGFVDDSFGWDFFSNDPYPYDGTSHGTHVAGIIAGKSESYFGVAPNVKIMPLRFLGNNGRGYTSSAIKAIYYAVDNGAKIINSSWGGGNYSNALKEAITYAQEHGVLFITSSGNDGVNIDRSKRYPAAYTMNNILSVAAMTSEGKLASYSNYGIQGVDLMAPGTGIYSTVVSGNYDYKSGTSMAAPFASGVAALVWSDDLGRNDQEVKQILIDSVRSIDDVSGKIFSGGLLNAARALYGEFDDRGVPPDFDPEQFDPALLGIKVVSYRPWYSRYYRATLFVNGPDDHLNFIQSVTYELENSSIDGVTTQDRDNEFPYKFTTPRTSYRVKLNILTKDGRNFTMEDNFNLN